MVKHEETLTQLKLVLQFKYKTVMKELNKRISIAKLFDVMERRPGKGPIWVNKPGKS